MGRFTVTVNLVDVILITAGVMLIGWLIWGEKPKDFWKTAENRHDEMENWHDDRD